MLLKTLAALLALMLGGVATSALVEGKERGRRHVAAPDANWVLLDTRAVDLKKDQDRFKVGASQGRFTSVMLVGLDRRIDVRRVSIHTDGEPYIDTERLRLEGGERSHPIQFSHEGGVVEHVDISYQLHLGAGGPAKVQLWGLRASPELPKAGAMGPGWAWIGTRSVDLWKEEDRIEVGTSKGHFKALMLVGRDRLIDITRVTIDTDGGQPRVDKQSFKLQKGQRSRPIQLSREGQAVRHVTLAYRLHLGAAGPANVELWGLRAGSEPVPVAVSTPTASSPAASEGPRLPLRGDAGGEETEGAVLFGVHDVGSTDQDVFKLGREYGRFQRLRLRALGAAVELKEVRVVYAGGDPDVLAVNAEVGTGEQTAWLDLNGERFIREIAFVYPQARRSKARLEIWGEYAESWFQPSSGTGAFAKANNGWLYLGGQAPLFVSIRHGLGYETDVVSVARNRGFSSLRLDVKNRAITLNRIKVIYADDSSDVFGERQRVAGGTSFGPVSLKAGQPVKAIEISHRSRLFDSEAQGSGYAFVEFWAK